MNREILFRGKCARTGLWRFGYLSNKDVINTDNGRIKIIPATIGQFTELTDKNGVKIWEGDICRIMMRKKYGHQEDKLSNPIGFVEYTRINVRDDSLYAFDTFNINGRSIQYLLSMELEVIGNIHDNPELIK